MRLRMLGTGSADGWPNPFCHCQSCESMRMAGRHRQATAALVDSTLMIDAGPTAGYAASAAGWSLASVEHLLLTHAHPDHLAPSLLLWRQWISRLGELHVWGPQSAIDSCRDWVGPDDPVTLHVVTAGEVIAARSALGTYQVSVLAANHDPYGNDVIAEQAVLFDITAPDGARLLYGTDTAAFTSDMAESVAEAHFDIVLLDETFGTTVDHRTGHHDLDTFTQTVALLRTVNAIDEHTDVIAIHLSHHNPPEGELAARLADIGARIVPDRADIGGARSRLVTGGARSGKSSYAEDLASHSRAVTYVATGYPALDEEWQERLRAHRARRPTHFTTIESIDLPQVLNHARANEVVLIDCITVWLTRTIDAACAWDDPALARHTAVGAVTSLVASLGACKADVILVTNEVGSGVIPANASGRMFADLLGMTNAQLAQACDAVDLVVVGQPIPIKRS